MKRRILLFALSFFLSIGVFGALYSALYLVKRAASTPADTEQSVTAPEQTTHTQAEQTTEPVSEEPAPVIPAPADEQMTTPEPPPIAEPAPVDDILPPAPVTPQEQPEATGDQQQTAQQSGETTLSEQPRTAEHGAALEVEAALNSENPAEALQQLVENGKVSKEAAEALLTWAQTHKTAGVENVGTSRRKDGSKVSRWRIKSENGDDDMIIEVVTSRGGDVVVESAKASSSDKTKIVASSDSLAVAEGFVEAVRRGDMAKAFSMIAGSKVNDAVVVGLCMIFEEAFELRKDAPIRNTFENDEFSGYLVYLVTRDNDTACNLSLNLTKYDRWKVTEVALDKLLSIYEQKGRQEGGVFFPIVKNPKGGDSLALFFDFDKAELSPRSKHQLKIVADVLMINNGKLNISGHTDDVGSDAYNQKLSEKRAAAVKDLLVSFGVKEEQITTQGFGKNVPLRPISGTDEDAHELEMIRGKNRRAEIYLDFES